MAGAAEAAEEVGEGFGEFGVAGEPEGEEVGAEEEEGADEDCEEV